MAVKSVTAVIDGQSYTLTFNSTTGKWEATIIAPNKSSYPETNHKFNVALTAVDQAGNTATVDRTDATLGETLQLRVLEKVAPVITPTYPSAGARITNATPTFAWTVIDNDSGVNPSTISITINGTKITSGITKNATSGGYSCTYKPSSALPEGDNVVKFNAADFDGNEASQVQANFIVDTVPPTLNVTAPTNGLITNVASLDVLGVTNDTTSSPCVVTIKLNNVDQGNATIDASGNFSKTLTLANGTNTIVVRSTDAAGKYSEVTRTVVLDQTPPQFVSVSIVPNPVDAGATYIISAEVIDT